MRRLVLFFAVLLAVACSAPGGAGAEGFDERLSAARELVTEVTVLRMSGDPAYKAKVHEAYRELVKLIRERPTMSEPYVLAGRCLLYNGRAGKAKTMWRKARYYSPGSADASILIGEVLTQQMKTARDELRMGSLDQSGLEGLHYSKAVKSFELALEQAGDDPVKAGEIYLKFGELNALAGKGEMARELWQKAAETAPGSPWAGVARARLAD